MNLLTRALLIAAATVALVPTTGPDQAHAVETNDNIVCVSDEAFGGRAFCVRRQF